ncbi:MAG: nicotinate-nucleotide adenylyltransferase [Lachnospiraceae bacterium]|nr:nicotinate-nucleotide adenylyltransferase [Lachnospiraceae bacterium]
METAKKKTRIGIMGGTFDPIHVGHLLIAENALEQYGLDQILFIPTGHSPHKDDREIERSAHRLEMIRLSVKDNPAFFFSTIEINSPEVSYTYLTLQQLQKHYPDWELYFIMGGDSLNYLEQWVQPEQICSIATILVAVRDGFDRDAIAEKIDFLRQKFSARIYPIDSPNVAISSSEIRQRVERKSSIRYLVTSEVEEYIDRNNLYKGQK